MSGSKSGASPPSATANSNTALHIISFDELEYYAKASFPESWEALSRAVSLDALFEEHDMNLHEYRGMDAYSDPPLSSRLLLGYDISDSNQLSRVCAYMHASSQKLQFATDSSTGGVGSVIWGALYLVSPLDKAFIPGKLYTITLKAALACFANYCFLKKGLINRFHIYNDWVLPHFESVCNSIATSSSTQLYSLRPQKLIMSGSTSDSTHHQAVTQVHMDIVSKKGHASTATTASEASLSGDIHGENRNGEVVTSRKRNHAIVHGTNITKNESEERKMCHMEMMKKLLESKEAERLLPPGDTKKMREEKNDLIKELEALKGSIVTTEEAWNQKLKDTQRELQMKDASVARLGREEKACMAKAAEEMEKLKTDLRTEQEQSSAKAEEITALQKNLDTEATARARAEQKARNAKRKLAAYQEDTEQKIETAKKLFTDHQYLLEYYCKNEPVPVKKSIMDSFEANYGLLKGPKQD